MSSNVEAITLSSLCPACGEPILRISPAEQHMSSSPFCQCCSNAMIEILHQPDDDSLLWTSSCLPPTTVSSPVLNCIDNSENLCCAACQKGIQVQMTTTTTTTTACSVIFCDLCQIAMMTPMETVSFLKDSAKNTKTNLQEPPDEEEDVVEVKTMSLMNVLEQKFQQAIERGEVVCMLDDDDDDNDDDDSLAVLEGNKSPPSNDGKVEFLYSLKPSCKEERSHQVSQETETKDIMRRISHQSKYIDV